MSQPPPPFMLHANQKLAETLVLTALSLFAERQLAQTPEWATQTNAIRQLQSLLRRPQSSWLELVDNLERCLPRLPGTFGQLARDFKLNAADFFMLSLCGVLESQHQAALLIGLLQQPEQIRPELHLICAIAAVLFKRPYVPLDLLQHALLTSGVLELEGDEPLPLRRLKMSPLLWRLLNEQTLHWPGCRPLTIPQNPLLPAPLQQRISQLVQLIGQQRIFGLVLRGERQNALLLAGKLAQELGLQPVVIDPAVMQDKQIGLLARYGRWLPILKPVLGPGEHLTLPDSLSAIPCIVALGRDGSVEAPGLLELAVSGLPLAQRRQLWQQLLPEFDSASIAETAQLSAPAIIDIAEQATLQAMQTQETVSEKHVVRARFLRSADQLRLLAQPVERLVDSEMLVLTDALNQQLRHLIQRCRCRETMSQGLGATLAGGINIGVKALFIGESGTGKTLAASFVAGNIAAPLYRVDLAAVMNKYIGETEKNLSLMLDQAADHDVVLLLDEADALFGKRSDGGEVGERFANMLTNFLLTRIEHHPGIIILTSNSQSRIDKAFMRRLDAVLEFTPPAFEQRLKLWQSHLGERGPDFEFVKLLAQHCELPGGYVRNAVLNAAVFIGDQQQAVSRVSLLQALAWEYQKLGRQMPPQLDRFRRE